MLYIITLILIIIIVYIFIKCVFVCMYNQLCIS